MVNVKHFINRCNNIKGWMLNTINRCNNIKWWMLNTLLKDVIILKGEC